MRVEAFASLRADTPRAMLTAIGIALGAGTLGAVIAVGAGRRAHVMALVSEGGLDRIVVSAAVGDSAAVGVSAGVEDRPLVPGAGHGVSVLFVEDARAIATLPNVEMTSAVQTQRGITVVNGDRSVVTCGVGAEPSWLEMRRWALADGEFVTDADMWEMSRVVMLGAKVAQALFPDGRAIGRTVHIADEPYTVKGVFLEMGTDARGEDRDDRVVVPLRTTMRSLFRRAHLEQIMIRVADPRRVSETAERVRALLRSRHNIAAGAPDGFIAREPEAIERTALETSSALRTLLLGLGVVALVAGGVAIMKFMLLVVSRRSGGTGVQRPTGAHDSHMARQVLSESLFISLAGGVIGLIVGLAVAIALSAAGVAPARITLMSVVLPLLACGGVGIISGIRPAQRAMGR